MRYEVPTACSKCLLTGVLRPAKWPHTLRYPTRKLVPTDSISLGPRICFLIESFRPATLRGRTEGPRDFGSEAVSEFIARTAWPADEMLTGTLQSGAVASCILAARAKRSYQSYILADC